MKGRYKIAINNTWQWFIVGGVAGYAVVHPFIMISAQMMSAAGPGRDISINAIESFKILSAFSYPMLPWSLGFGLLTGTVALLAAKMRQVRLQKVKLQAVMELAGATCHELHQPMQVIQGYAQMISKNMLETEDLRPIHEEMIAQIKRMDSILKKINNITSYETCEYVNGIQIIDIEKSSKNNTTCESARPYC